jgi:pimeloyl-ACP methyl ester carboxylesterase
MTNGGGYADVNGLRMYYETRGQGPPLLLLHGGTSAIDPTEVALFSDTFRVIAPEQMGHGRTADAPDRQFHYHDMAEDTIELMRQLKIDAAFVFGFSDGGVLGLDMAIHHPDRVSRLAVSGTNFRVDGFRAETLEWVRATKADDWPQALRDAYEQLSPDGRSHWPVFLDRVKTMWFAEPNFTTEQLASIRAPTLVIAGDQDWITLEHTITLFRAIPNSQLSVLPNTGHGGPPPQGTIKTFLMAADTSEGLLSVTAPLSNDN